MKRFKSKAFAAGLLFVSQIGLINSVAAATADGKAATPPPVITTNADESWIHAFIAETIASKNYHYSHGINNGDKGPYYQSDLILFLTLYKGDGFINQVNFTLFTWSSLRRWDRGPGIQRHLSLPPMMPWRSETTVKITNLFLLLESDFTSREIMIFGPRSRN